MASLYDSASLVMIPSGYKEDKIYSIKPTDGSGDLTFSRSNDTATRVNSDGLIEKVRTNLLTYSQDFTNPVWTKSNVSATGGQTDPNGGTTASLVQTTTAASAYFYQTQSGAKAFSIYAKAGTRNNFSIINGIYNNGASFNLSTQTTTSAGAGSLAKIEDVGGGWYRCSVYVSTSSDMIIMLADVSGGGMNVGDNLYFAFAQAETGDIATDYIATTTAAVSVGPVANLPRLDYLDSSCPKLLLEPQRTNSAQYSESFDNAAWVKQTDTTISSNATTSPDGYTNADKLVNSTSVNRQAIYQNSSLTGVVSFSVFAKKAEYDVIQLTDGRNPTFFANFDLTNGVLGSFVGYTASIQDYGNGWYRCAVSADYGALTVNQIRISLAQTPTEARLVEFAGSGTDGVFLYGCQVEAGAYETSYIPTLSAASTRGADSASKTGISSLIGQTEGTLFWEVQIDTPVATANEAIFNIDAGAFGNTIYLTKSATGNIVGEMYVSSAAQASFTLSGISAGNYKIAFAYAQNNTAMFVNGVQVGATDTSCNVPAMSRIQLGNGALGPSTDKTKQALLFPTRLTDAEAIALTTL